MKVKTWYKVTIALWATVVIPAVVLGLAWFGLSVHAFLPTEWSPGGIIELIFKFVVVLLPLLLLPFARSNQPGT